MTATADLLERAERLAEALKRYGAVVAGDGAALLVAADDGTTQIATAGTMIEFMIAVYANGTAGVLVAHTIDEDAGDDGRYAYEVNVANDDQAIGVVEGIIAAAEHA